MNPLAETLKEKIGLSDEMALQASNVAFAFIKERLPDSIAPYVDKIAAGQDAGDLVSGALGSIGGGALGGLFGGGGDEDGQ